MPDSTHEDHPVDELCLKDEAEYPDDKSWLYKITKKLIAIKEAFK